MRVRVINQRTFSSEHLVLHCMAWSNWGEFVAHVRATMPGATNIYGNLTESTIYVRY